MSIQTEEQAKNADPREKGRKPPFPDEKQAGPGHESQMETKPDHGETSYKGNDRLKDKKALITGGG